MFSHVSVCVSVHTCRGYPYLSDTGLPPSFPMGGILSFLKGGYPHPWSWGIPHLANWGDTPIWLMGECARLDNGVPHLAVARGGTQIWPMGYSPLGLDGGTPIWTGWVLPFRAGLGTPLSGEWALATWLAVCLLHSRRRTFLLFYCSKCSLEINILNLCTFKWDCKNQDWGRLFELNKTSNLIVAAMWVFPSSISKMFAKQNLNALHK